MYCCIKCQDVHISNIKALGTRIETTNTKYLGKFSLKCEGKLINCKVEDGARNCL